MKSLAGFSGNASYRKLFTHLLFCAAMGLAVYPGCEIRSDDTETSDAQSLQQWQVTADLQVQELLPGVWIHISWATLSSGYRFSSNGLIILEEDSVLIIDTAWGEQATEDLLNWIEDELSVPVNGVIATHAHADRMGGAGTVEARGIPLYAHPLSFEMAASHGWPEPKSIGDLSPGDAVTLGTVEVFYPGPAHAPGNIMVYVPDSRLLAGGCAVKSSQSKTMGNLADADLVAWPDSIERTSNHYPDAERVLPGHGEVGGPELLLHTDSLLKESE